MSGDREAQAGRRRSPLAREVLVLPALQVADHAAELRRVLTEVGAFSDPATKLLLFTEHKDTLDYLAGDGKDGRPLGRLREWGLTVTQIHGGMKIGDRDTPGSRIYAEREFRAKNPKVAATAAPTMAASVTGTRSTYHAPSA